MAAGDRPTADPHGLDALRTDALRWLAPSISHELSNPLSALVAFSGLLAADPRLPADLQADVRMLRDEAERTNNLVRTVLEVLRDRPAVAAPVDVAVLLDEVLALATPLLTDVELVRLVDDPRPVAETDPSRLRQLLLVLVAEALRAVGDRARGPRLRIELTQPTAGRVLVAIDYRPAPDATGAEPRIETGEASLPDIGGTLVVERDATGGRFAVNVPAAERTAAEWSTSAPTRQAPTGLTVVVCDDEDAIRTLLVRVLERDGMRAIAAPDGASAIAALDASDVDVVVTDHLMTGMTGIELYERAVAARPALRRRFVVMSGEPGSDDLRAFTERTGVRTIPKPFDLPAIPALVREVARGDAAAGQRG